MINIFQPNLGNEELERLQEVFRSNWIGKGQQVVDFEKAFALSLDADPQHFTSTTCCTEGLFLSTELFGFGGRLHAGSHPSVVFPPYTTVRKPGTTSNYGMQRQISAAHRCEHCRACSCRGR